MRRMPSCPFSFLVEFLCDKLSLGFHILLADMVKRQKKQLSQTIGNAQDVVVIATVAFACKFIVPKNEFFHFSLISMLMLFLSLSTQEEARSNTYRHLNAHCKSNWFHFCCRSSEEMSEPQICRCLFKVVRTLNFYVIISA